jgi:putative colanic acid biosynthesis acetyltransferase WcaF
MSAARRAILRIFGARLGRGVVIKPGVRVKYPWMLEVGNHCWIGEDCWIDNMAPIVCGDDVCLSQGVYVCTGNHDWSDTAFGLIVQPVRFSQGSWVGAKALVGPGTRIGECAVVTAGSVVNGSVPAYEIYSGNPARFVRKREFRMPALQEEK